MSQMAMRLRANKTKTPDKEASNETDDELAEEQHLPQDAKKKVLTRGQKKILAESLENMQKEDCATWSVLQGGVKRHVAFFLEVVVHSSWRCWQERQHYPAWQRRWD